MASEPLIGCAPGGIKMASLVYSAGNAFPLMLLYAADPGGSQMLSDVNLTPREDKTIDFSDQDQTYKAVLYRCPD
jgi:hypothetical protein